MSTITKEWLQKAISQNESMRDEIPFGWDEDDINMLEALRIALASMEAKSRKLFTCSGCGAEGLDEPLESKCHCNEDGAHWVESVVYTAPPAPVSVPNGRAITQHFDTIALETAREIMCDVNRRHEFLGGEVQLLSRIQCRIDDACRSAMLQGAEQPQSAQQNIPEIIPGGLVEAVNNLLNNDGSRGRYSAIGCGEAREKIELWLAQRQKWESQRSEKLFAGNSPAIPDGWVACSERMPEEDTYNVVADIGSEGNIYCAAAAWFIHGNFSPMDGVSASNYDGGASIEIDMHISHWMPLKPLQIK